MKHFATIVLLSIFVLGCSDGAQDTIDDPTPNAATRPKPADLPAVAWTEGETSTEDAPEEGEFVVQFETTAGDFKIKVDRSWAPRGAERFYQLVKNKYYDGSPFYRVLPGFMAQFGMCGDPKGTRYWGKEFPDDPVVESNLPGFVSYAMSGPGTRTTQLFINYGDNSPLDVKQFSPFGKVIEGMDSVRAINSNYREMPQQPAMSLSGNKYVFSKFPEIDYIVKVTFVEGGDAEAEGKTEESADDQTEESADDQTE